MSKGDDLVRSIKLAFLSAFVIFSVASASAHGAASRSYREEVIHFSDGPDHLTGVLCLPYGHAPFPVVAYVAGSGPAGRDGYGVLPPHWEAFARRGIASLAWDKPGVGESTGDWKSQTNQDRAREVVAAINFLKGRPEIDPRKIGLWGISQAGWILPIAYSMAPKDIAFIISVSGPVGTGAEQELYRVSRGLPADGFSAADTEKAVAFTKRRLALMKAGAPFEQVDELQREYEKEPWFAPLGKLDRGAYEFLKANAFFSPRPLLEKITCPVLAIFGEKDTIVNARESSRVYAEALRKAGDRDVTIKFFPDADHVLFPSKTGGEKELDRSFQRPQKVFAPGYLETMAEWVQKRFVSGR